MKLHEALAQAGVGLGGYRTARRGRYAAYQDRTGQVSIHERRLGGSVLPVWEGHPCITADDWEPIR